MPRRLAYASTPASDLSSSEIARILHVSRENNAASNVRGVLIYTGDAFAQWIEGEPAVVERLWLAIRGDPRHRDVVAFLDERDDQPWLASGPPLAFLFDPALGSDIAEWRSMRSRLGERERDAIRLLLASGDTA